MENNNEDVQEYLTNIWTKELSEIKEKFIRNIDDSKLNIENMQSMLRAIARSEFEIDILLTLTEKVGGFGSSYAEECVSQLKIFRIILEMELKKSDVEKPQIILTRDWLGEAVMTNGCIKQEGAEKGLDEK